MMKKNTGNEPQLKTFPETKLHTLYAALSHEARAKITVADLECILDLYFNLEILKEITCSDFNVKTDMIKAIFKRRGRHIDDTCMNELMEHIKSGFFF